MEIIIGWLVLAVLVGIFADSRGRSGFGYFLLSAFLSPLLGFIIVLVTRDLKKEEAREVERLRKEERDAYDRKMEHEKQIEALRAIATPARPPAPEPVDGKSLSAAEEIEKLATLLERGLLTEEEFRQQKTAVLQRQR